MDLYDDAGDDKTPHMPTKGELAGLFWRCVHVTLVAAVIMVGVLVLADYF